MTIAWMLYVLLVGTLLAVGAWGVEDALRYAKLPTRWVWTAAMLATVAFAGYALRGDSATASVMPPFVAKAAASSNISAPSAHGIGAAIEAARAFVTASIVAATARIPAAVVRWALFAWAAASMVLLLLHLAVNRRVIQQRRTWPLATLPGGIVRVAPTLGPAVVGLAWPEIVVPRWLLEKSSEEQHLVMVHEQEHISARDQYLPVVATLIATLLPWHPAVWWSLARLRLAVELDCDARVLRRGIHARPYGSLLIDIAGQCAGHRTGALALADRPSHLERRLRAMTYRTSRFTLARTIGFAAVAGLAVLAACEAKLPTSAEVQSMDVASAEKAMVQFKVVDDRSANIDYIVDGVTVTAEKAHAIPAKQIASVNVMKATPATPADSSRMRTVVRINTIGAATAAADSGFVMTMSGLRSLDSSGAMSGQHMKFTNSRGTIFSDSVKVSSTENGAKSKTFDGVLLVDGVQVPASQLAALEPGAIESVEIIKGAAAAKLSSDAAAANGIIRVTMKKK
ncbi:MAG: TonB-dependent receptor plug domain-containing protein [Gemmatimonadota bacterium]|nr:TonB-dependent receptor plug domain-containing protein [Gemmatimonadota bacterium]